LLGHRMGKQELIPPSARLFPLALISRQSRRKLFSWSVKRPKAFSVVYKARWGKRWRSWLRHCATSPKVAGFIPEDIIWIFHWQSFRPHYGPEVDSASNRNEYQEYFLGKRPPVCRADNYTTLMCRLSWNLGASTSWKRQGLSRPDMRLL